MPSIIRNIFYIGLTLFSLCAIVVLATGVATLAEENSALRTAVVVGFGLSFLCIGTGMVYEHKNQKPF